MKYLPWQSFTCPSIEKNGIGTASKWKVSFILLSLHVISLQLPVHVRHRVRSCGCQRTHKIHAQMQISLFDCHEG